MARELKRFTITVSTDIEDDLHKAKQVHFYKTTRNEMIRTLIIRGLKVLKDEVGGKGINHDKSA